MGSLKVNGINYILAEVLNTNLFLPLNVMDEQSTYDTIDPFIMVQPSKNKLIKSMIVQILDHEF